MLGELWGIWRFGDDWLYPLCFEWHSECCPPHLFRFIWEACPPLHTPTSMLGTAKYETVNCYPICPFIRSLGRQPHFFLLSTAMPHTFTVLSKVWVFSDLVASQCLLRDALHCLLLYFFSEEDCSAGKIMLTHSSIYKKIELHETLEDLEDLQDS